MPPARIDRPASACIDIGGWGRAALHRDRRLTIGGIHHDADIRLQTRGITQPMTLQRRGDEGDVMVRGVGMRINEEVMERAWVSDGDRIAIGDRGRIRLRRPIAPSATLLIELTAAQTKQRDLRCIVWLGDVMILGKGDRPVHAVIPSLSTDLLLWHEGDGYRVRRRRDRSSVQALPAGELIRYEGLDLQLRFSSAATEPPTP